jgi:prolyl-tRNA synthetase
MRYSQLFTKTEKTLPAGEEARNAQLLIQAGFIRKEMAGVYSFLPLGLRVLRKIEQIVREEMDKIGCQELLMPALCPQENWQKTRRWDTVDVLYKLELPNGKQAALSPTHEEVVTPLVQHYLSSPKSFPACVYQFQWKFRNEARAKSGLLRGREFLMKDAYSFHTSEEDFEKFYAVQKKAYHRIYDRLGIGDITHVVAADGGDFSEFSHEFQAVSEIGEDLIFKDPETGEYFNKEVVSEENQKNWESLKAVEVGNIFPLADKFSKAFNFKSEGKNIIMGCYGIGITRIMGVLAEIFSDAKGLKWPKKVAPFHFYLAPIGKSDAVYEKSDEIYKKFLGQGMEVFYDDRRDKKVGPGQKFADHELMGIPFRVVISEKLLAEGKYEVVCRENGEVEMLDFESMLAKFTKES